MRNTLYLLLTLVLVTVCPTYAQAPAPCAAPTLAQMPQNFTDWHWELGPSDPEYCRMWIINRSNASPNLLKVDAPWVAAQGGPGSPFYAMQQSMDYTPAKGWVLIKRDFGSRTALQLPYFVLYNKYMGVLRAFFYVDATAGTYSTGVLVTLESTNSPSGRSSAVMAPCNALIPAPDKYLQNATGAAETMTYVTKLSGQSSWVMGEFNMGFDPNAGNASYQSSALSFTVHGIVENTVALSGALDWKTIKDDGYGFGGKKPTVVDPAAGPKKFLASNQKLLSKVSAQDAEKFLQSVNDEAANIAFQARSHSVTENAALDVFALTKAGATLPSFLNKVLKIANGASQAFGVIGSVFGMLFPSEVGGASVVPTVSKGTISLNGTITTQYPLGAPNIQTPGTQHPNDPTTQPYYDCPLGVFAIKNTPVLKAIRHMGVNDLGLRTYYVSYEVANDLIASYNKSAGLKLMSVQAALVSEHTEALPVLAPPIDTYDPSQTFSRHTYTLDSPLVENQFDAGFVKLVSYDAASRHSTYQTDFVDLGSFKGMALTTYGDSWNYQQPYGIPGRERNLRYLQFEDDKVYVRVKAVLQVENNPNIAPIYFVQDYAVDKNVNATPTNPAWVTNYNPRDPDASWNVGLAPFTNIKGTLDRPIHNYVIVSTPSGANWQYIIQPYNLNPSAYTTPIKISSFSNILASSSVIDHPGTATTSSLLASESVFLGAGFSVTSGTNFVASTSLLTARNIESSSQLREEPYNASCLYNTVAFARGVLAAETTKLNPSQTLEVYPNPTAGLLYIVVTSQKPGSTIELHDLLGRSLQIISGLPMGKRTIQIDLAGHTKGVYIVQLRTATETLYQKVLLE